MHYPKGIRSFSLGLTRFQERLPQEPRPRISPTRNGLNLPAAEADTCNALCVAAKQQQAARVKLDSLTANDLHRNSQSDRVKETVCNSPPVRQVLQLPPWRLLLLMVTYYNPRSDRNRTLFFTIFEDFLSGSAVGRGYISG